MIVDNIPITLEPPSTWIHYSLWKTINNILKNIPKYFKSVITVSGISATEIYKYGELLGATIENEVVRTLNTDLRLYWDENNKYRNYSFIRQEQTFPDVLLQNIQNVDDIIMGIELKSWYILSKESEPSFRYKVTPKVCLPQDLFMVVPWVLSNVLSGSPRIFEPYIQYALFLSEYRNYWWKYIRKSNESNEIRTPINVKPYPNAKSEISDSPINDKGNNFGRIARLGLMDDYITKIREHVLLDVTVNRWIKFFKETEDCIDMKKNTKTLDEYGQ